MRERDSQRDGERELCVMADEDMGQREGGGAGGGRRGGAGGTIARVNQANSQFIH